VVADEPVSALDVSVQGQIVTLLQDLQSRLGVAYIFIAHDLAVCHIAHRVAVMYLGRIETAPAEQLFAAHITLTRNLLSAVPEPDPDAPQPHHPARRLASPLAIPQVQLPNRCPIAQPICAETPPPYACRTHPHRHLPLRQAEPDRGVTLPAAIPIAPIPAASTPAAARRFLPRNRAR
jgi:peptide/nickel transport system ATP-binding protein